MNITLDDTSPQIFYYSPTVQAGTWSTNHTDDAETPEYFDGTFHGTYANGDYMTLTFNGSAIYVYGGKRANHGTYGVTLDGGSESFMSGYGNNQLQALLYSAGGLSDSQHTITMTNLPLQTDPPGNATYQWWLDIDYIVITTHTTGQIYTTKIDDSSTYASYSGTGWNGPTAGSHPGYYNSTAHIDGVSGDSMTLRFNGSSVQLFGGLNTDHGNYTIALDGVNQPNPFTGTFMQLETQVPLFTASGLTDGPHTIVMATLPLSSSLVNVDFDYAVVNSTINPNGVTGNSTGTNSTTSTADGQGSTSSGGSNTGAIAGGVVGGVVVLAILGVLAWWFLRKKQRGKRVPSSDPIDLTGDEVKPFPHGGAGGAYGSSPGLMGYSASQVHHSQHSLLPSNSDASPQLSSIPQPPPSIATSYPRSVNPPSTFGGSPTAIPEGMQFPLPDPYHPVGSSAYGGYVSPTAGSVPSGSSMLYTPSAPASVPASVSSGAASAAGDISQHQALNPTTPTEALKLKTPGVVLPFTARPPAPQSSMSDSNSSFSALSTSPLNRMAVHGREQDLGPMGEVHHETGEDTLPPNYEQATEPLPNQRPHAESLA